MQSALFWGIRGTGRHGPWDNMWYWGKRELGGMAPGTTIRGIGV